MIQKIRNIKGFTLVELMIFIMIIAMLALIAFQAFLGASSNTIKNDKQIEEPLDLNKDNNLKDKKL